MRLDDVEGGQEILDDRIAAMLRAYEGPPFATGRVRQTRSPKRVAIFASGLAVLAVIVAAGALSQSDRGGRRNSGDLVASQSAKGSCPAVLRWRGVEYIGTAVRLRPVVGAPLGEATRPRCGGEGPTPVAVSRIEDVLPEVAISAPRDRSVIYVAQGAREPFPPALERALFGPACELPGRFAITGELVGESNLNEPFTIQLDVSRGERGGQRFRGQTIRLRPTSQTSGLATRAAFREFTFYDQFRAEVRCIEADRPDQTFIANEIRFVANGPYCGKTGNPCHDPASGKPRRRPEHGR